MQLERFQEDDRLGPTVHRGHLAHRHPGHFTEGVGEELAPDPSALDERVVDVHVANLRRKLGDDAADPWLIETIPSTGYRLVAARDPS